MLVVAGKAANPCSNQFMVIKDVRFVTKSTGWAYSFGGLTHAYVQGRLRDACPEETCRNCGGTHVIECEEHGLKTPHEICLEHRIMRKA